MRRATGGEGRRAGSGSPYSGGVLAQRVTPPARGVVIATGIPEACCCAEWSRTGSMARTGVVGVTGHRVANSRARGQTKRCVTSSTQRYA